MDELPPVSEKPVGKCNVAQQSDEIRNFVKKHDKVLSYLIAMLTDCYELIPSYDYDEFTRDKETITRRFSHEGLSFATKTLPSFFDSILTYLETGTSAYPSFKIQRGCTYPVFLRQLVAPLYENSYDATDQLRVLYQLCVSFKKLKGPYKQSVITNHLRDFVDVDRNLPIFSKTGEVADDYGNLYTVLSEDDKTILFYASTYIEQLVGDLDPFDPAQANNFLPRPGPGATNTPTKRCDRYRPAVRYAQLERSFNFDEWYSCPSPLHPQNSRWDLRCRKSYKAGGETTNFVPTSRYKCVHKTYGKPRGICIEQLEVQYFQQGIRNALYKRTERMNPRSVTQGFVNFTDQSKNGKIALESSLSGTYATIDMSAASDRISRSLVQWLFAWCPTLLSAMLACSTRVIELPEPLNYRLACRKFAPMGSALCFPVMGLVHWALIKAVFKFYVHTQESIPIWVYGDDIIVPSHLANLVYEHLPTFGMKLNVDKSFVNSRFRESCGMNAFNGVDITPTRFKTLVKNPFVMTDLISMLRNEYDLHCKGFANTARAIRQDILKVCNGWVIRNLPTVGPKSQVLGWIRDDCDAPTFRHLHIRKRRWNPDLQLTEVHVLVLVPRSDVPPSLSEHESYLRWFINPMVDEEQRRESGEVPVDQVAVWEWVPTSALCGSTSAAAQAAKQSIVRFLRGVSDR